MKCVFDRDKSLSSPPACHSQKHSKFVIYWTAVFPIVRTMHVDNYSGYYMQRIRLGIKTLPQHWYREEAINVGKDEK